MDVELLSNLSRAQFAITIAFHFLFPPITIGLGLMLTITEWLGWKKNDEMYVKISKFFSKLLAITFAVGVASGLVMVLQFGTNWSMYSRFVGDIFGAPLAAEAIFAFFLESAFLGLYLFGRGKVSKGMHWFSILMVTVGSLISAFWIIVANSWQQTPAGFAIQNLVTGEIINNVDWQKLSETSVKSFDPTQYRAILTNFFDAVFNPSALLRFFHTVLASFITGAFIFAGSCAYLIRKKRNVEIAHKGLKLSIVLALIFAVLQLFPSGHEHARQVANTQGPKFAGIQGLYTSENAAPLLLFGYVSNDVPPQLKAKIGIPGILSYMVTGDFNAKLKGMNEFAPENRPPAFVPFVSYHNMVILGGLFILVSLLGVIQIKRKKLLDSKFLLRAIFWMIPLPVIACQFGWAAAEVGRQPWIVYGLLRTKDAFSPTVSAAEVWISLILFTVFYLIMTVVYIYLMMKKIKAGIEPENENQSKEALA